DPVHRGVPGRPPVRPRRPLPGSGCRQTAPIGRRSVPAGRFGLVLSIAVPYGSENDVVQAGGAAGTEPGMRPGLPGHGGPGARFPPRPGRSAAAFLHLGPGRQSETVDASRAGPRLLVSCPAAGTGRTVQTAP